MSRDGRIRPRPALRVFVGKRNSGIDHQVIDRTIILRNVTGTSENVAAITVSQLETWTRADLDLIARRMRATLVEFLGEKAGKSLYTLAWLRDRAALHLDGTCEGGIFVARLASGESVGHIIVRIESDEVGPLGLVSTIYVEPAYRRRGAACQLVDAAHRWFQARGMKRYATNTSKDNAPLIRLLDGLGYRIALHFEEKNMVQLMKQSVNAAAGI